MNCNALLSSPPIQMRRFYNVPLAGRLRDWKMRQSFSIHHVETVGAHCTFRALSRKLPYELNCTSPGERNWWEKRRVPQKCSSSGKPSSLRSGNFPNAPPNPVLPPSKDCSRLDTRGKEKKSTMAAALHDPSADSLSFIGRCCCPSSTSELLRKAAATHLHRRPEAPLGKLFSRSTSEEVTKLPLQSPCGLCDKPLFSPSTASQRRCFNRRCFCRPRCFSLSRRKSSHTAAADGDARQRKLLLPPYMRAPAACLT